ncbi:MAG: hypothetical protein FJ134_16330 [Deltaproteobacteria bacterium]|nr:hypothetical protein [Deltaproteobacteria bacterium]
MFRKIFNRATVFYGLLALSFFLLIPGLTTSQVQAQSPQAKPKITLSGGPGDSMATAIVIKGAPNSMAGIDAEYYYLSKKFGRPNLDWKLKKQSVQSQGGRHYDLMEIELKDGSQKKIFFDITEFYGKL